MGLRYFPDVDLSAAKQRFFKRCLADIMVLIRTHQNSKLTGLFQVCLILVLVDVTDRKKIARMRLLLLISLLTRFWALSIAAEPTSSEDNTQPTHSLYTRYGDQDVQDPLQMGAMLPQKAANSPRHRQELAHLMNRMERKHGNWGSNHPRHRLLEALLGFSKYRERSMAELDRWRDLYKNVGRKQKRVSTRESFIASVLNKVQALDRVVNYDKKLDEIEELIYENLMVCKSIVSNAMHFYSIGQKELDAHVREAEKSGRQADRISVSQTLKHFVRDWAEEGSKERNDAFPCILSTVSDLKAKQDGENPIKVLLPGSGLGRLGHEVANLGGQTLFLLTLYVH
jgi:hypothetical protein